MKIRKEDLEFMGRILPSHYNISIEGNNAIHCKSNVGLKNESGDDDDEHWEYIFNGIKSYFNERFSEVFSNTCTYHLDFLVYLRS